MTLDVLRVLITLKVKLVLGMKVVLKVVLV